MCECCVGPTDPELVMMSCAAVATRTTTDPVDFCEGRTCLLPVALQLVTERCAKTALGHCFSFCFERETMLLPEKTMLLTASVAVTI